MYESTSFQDLSKFEVSKGFRGRNLFAVQFWWLVDAVLFRPSPQVMYAWRRFILRRFGAKIGKNVRIRASVAVTYPWKVSIGDHSWIGDDAVLYSLAPITIEANCVISQRSYLCAGSHKLDSEAFEIIGSPIVVRNGAWLATDVFVGPGVTIGANSIVGARSSVFKDLPPMGIFHGSPARFIKKRICQQI